MSEEKQFKFNYTIDTADWGSGCEMDREKCEVLAKIEGGEG